MLEAAAGLRRELRWMAPTQGGQYCFRWVSGFAGLDWKQIWRERLNLLVLRRIVMGCIRRPSCAVEFRAGELVSQPTGCALVFLPRRE